MVAKFDFIALFCIFNNLHFVNEKLKSANSKRKISLLNEALVIRSWFELKYTDKQFQGLKGQYICVVEVWMKFVERKFSSKISPHVPTFFSLKHWELSFHKDFSICTFTYNEKFCILNLVSHPTFDYQFSTLKLLSFVSVTFQLSGTVCFVFYSLFDFN